MKRTLIFLAVVMLAARFVSAEGGPYSILNGTLVKIDPSYQTTVPIGDISNGVGSIEFSVDGFIYGVDAFSDTLVKIDPLDGDSETVGPLGFDLDWETDLDEDGDGRLWLLQSGTGELFTIDRTTGAASLQCQANNPDVFGLAIHDGRFFTSGYGPNPPDPGCGLELSGGTIPYMETGPDGWIHTLIAEPFGFQYTSFIFSRFNPMNGASHELGRFGPGDIDEFYGLTFDPVDQPPPAIPTLDWQGRAMLILLLTIAGTAILAHSSTGRF